MLGAILDKKSGRKLLGEDVISEISAPLQLTAALSWALSKAVVLSAMMLLSVML